MGFFKAVHSAGIFFKWFTPLKFFYLVHSKTFLNSGYHLQLYFYLGSPNFFTEYSLWFVYIVFSMVMSIVFSMVYYIVSSMVFLKVVNSTPIFTTLIVGF